LFIENFDDIIKIAKKQPVLFYGKIYTGDSNE